MARRPDREGPDLTRSPEPEEVLSVLRAENAAFFRGDYDALASFWLQTPEARRFFTGPVMGTRISVGWDQISENFREAIENFPQTYQAAEYLRWINVQVCTSPDMAWVSYDQVLLREAAELHAQSLQHEMKILHRVDGVWKIACIMVIAPDVAEGDTPRVYLDDEGKVSRMNRLAQARIGDHPGIMISGGRIRARQRRFDAALQAEIGRAQGFVRTMLPPGLWHRSIRALPLGESDDGKPVYCWIHTDGECVVLSFDDEAMQVLRLDVAAETYALSPAQRALAGLLAEGRELADAAEVLGVSVNTVRTHLRRMFEKTGTHAQPALISMLLSVVPPE